MKSIAPHRQSRTGRASALRPKLVCGALTAAVLVLTMPPAYAEPDEVRFKFRNITNENDPTFNQELGINNHGVIAGYFGSGAAGHPDKGYTVVRPYKHPFNFTNENFPGSVQTQVTGLNNSGTSGFERGDRVFRGTSVVLKAH